MLVAPGTPLAAPTFPQATAPAQEWILAGVCWPPSFHFLLLFKSALLRSISCVAFISECKRGKRMLVVAVFICGAVKVYCR